MTTLSAPSPYWARCCRARARVCEYLSAVWNAEPSGSTLLSAVPDSSAACRSTDLPSLRCIAAFICSLLQALRPTGHWRCCRRQPVQLPQLWDTGALSGGLLSPLRRESDGSEGGQGLSPLQCPGAGHCSLLSDLPGSPGAHAAAGLSTALAARADTGPVWNRGPVAAGCPRWPVPHPREDRPGWDGCGLQGP